MKSLGHLNSCGTNRVGDPNKNNIRRNIDTKLLFYIKSITSLIK